MTREEAIANLKMSDKYCLAPFTEAVKMAIEALEQEPCKDAISRQAAKKVLEDRFIELQKRHSENRYETNFCLNTILELPSVIPQQRTGRWIKDEHGGQYKWVCSNCGTYHRALYDYCPSCGAKM